MKKSTGVIVAALLTAPMIAQADSWTGAYAGFALGTTSVEDKGYEYDSGTDDYTQDTKFNSVSYGVFGGYNQRLGQRFVVGAEVDYNRNTGKGESYQLYKNVPDSSYPITVKLNDSYAVQARFGYLVNENVLLFATAGYAGSSAERLWIDSPAQVSTDRQNGWTAGVGFEYAYSDHMGWGLEYRHADYGNADSDASVAYGGNTVEKMELTADIIRASLTYHF